MIDLVKEKIELKEVNYGVYEIIDSQVYLGHRKIEGLKLKTLRNYDDEIKLVVDYGFKGNSRLPDDKSDYYIADIKNKKVYAPVDNDYQFLVEKLNIIQQEIKGEQVNTFLMNDVIVISLTVSKMVEDGWRFKEDNDGLIATNDEEMILFNNINEYQNWILEKATEY